MMVNENGANAAAEANVTTAGARIRLQPKIPSLAAFSHVGKSDIHQFIESFEQLALSANWPTSELASILPGYLGGSVIKFYNHEIRGKKTDWEEIKALLIETYSPIKANRFPELYLHSRKYDPNVENIQSYFYNKLDMCTKAKLSEEQSLSYIIDGLPDNLKVLTTAKADIQLDDLLPQLRKLEEDLPSQNADVFSVNTITLDQLKGIIREATQSQSDKITHADSLQNVVKSQSGFVPGVPMANVVYCQICSKRGHTAMSCYQLVGRPNYGQNPRFPYRQMYGQPRAQMYSQYQDYGQQVVGQGAYGFQPSVVTGPQMPYVPTVIPNYQPYNANVQQARFANDQSQMYKPQGNWYPNYRK